MRGKKRNEDDILWMRTFKYSKLNISAARDQIFLKLRLRGQDQTLENFSNH